MKLIIKSLFLFAILFLQGCNTECGECFTPPQSFAFDLVDKVGGDNLFANELFNSNDIEIINLAENTEVEFRFIAENGYNIIEINTIGWKTEKVNYSFNIADKHIFNLYVDAERLNDNCCSYTVYNEIEIADAEYAWESSRGIYQILVE